MKQDDLILLRIDKVTKRDLEREARKRKLTLSELVRHLIKQLLTPLT